MRNYLTALSNVAAEAGGFFRLDMEADQPTIWLYTMIGKDYDWITDSVVGVSDEEFIRALMECRRSPVTHLRINSPGGSVFKAKAMQTAMMEFPGKLVVHVDGVAASAAASLTAYGSEVIMSVNSFLMIHKAMGPCYGTDDDMIHSAGVLKQMNESIASDFARKTGLKQDEIMEMMAKTTYIDAQTAKDKGFCDSILEPETKIQNSFDLSIYGAAMPEQLWIVKKDEPQKPEPVQPAAYDRAQIERRLRLIERAAA